LENYGFFGLCGALVGRWGKGGRGELGAASRVCLICMHVSGNVACSAHAEIKCRKLYAFCGRCKERKYLKNPALFGIWKLYL